MYLEQRAQGILDEFATINGMLEQIKRDGHDPITFMEAQLQSGKYERARQYLEDKQ